jgi:hypothetical protein
MYPDPGCCHSNAFWYANQCHCDETDNRDRRWEVLCAMYFIQKAVGPVIDDKGSRLDQFD